jgi:DNA-binding NarL/FixJ family response regulator
MATHLLRAGRDRGRSGARIEIVLADDANVGGGTARAALQHEPQIVVLAETGWLIDLAELAARLAPQVIVLATGRRDATLDAAIRSVRRAHPATEVVLVSPYADEAAVRAGLVAGARGYLAYDDPDIGRAVRAVVSGGAYFSPLVANVVRCGYLRRAGLDLDVVLRPLSDADRRVLRSLVRGRSNVEIEVELGWSAGELLASRRRIVEALGVEEPGVRSPIRAGSPELGH